MIPEWVDSLASYLRWFDQVVEGSGGHLSHPPSGSLEVELAEQARVDLRGRECFESLYFPKHRLDFWGGVRLEFSLIVLEWYDHDDVWDRDVEDYDYSFSVMEASGQLIVRYDRHGDDDHHGVGVLHRHVGLPDGGELIEPAPEWDIEQAVDLARELAVQRAK